MLPLGHGDTTAILASIFGGDAGVYRRNAAVDKGDADVDKGDAVLYNGGDGVCTKAMPLFTTAMLTIMAAYQQLFVSSPSRSAPKKKSKKTQKKTSIRQLLYRRVCTHLHTHVPLVGPRVHLS